MFPYSHFCHCDCVMQNSLIATWLTDKITRCSNSCPLNIILHRIEASDDPGGSGRDGGMKWKKQGLNWGCVSELATAVNPAGSFEELYKMHLRTVHTRDSIRHHSSWAPWVSTPSCFWVVHVRLQSGFWGAFHSTTLEKNWLRSIEYTAYGWAEYTVSLHLPRARWNLCRNDDQDSGWRDVN